MGVSDGRLDDKKGVSTVVDRVVVEDCNGYTTEIMDLKISLV